MEKLGAKEIDHLEVSWEKVPVSVDPAGSAIEVTQYVARSLKQPWRSMQIAQEEFIRLAATGLARLRAE